MTALTMTWKFCQEAEKRWNRIFGYKLLSLVMHDKKFVDCELVEEVA
jgi:hypothetical protein